jgi:acetyl-CoA carboxylase biotin carboxyl carrier protein
MSEEQVMTQSLNDALRAVSTLTDLVRAGGIGGIRLRIGDLQIDVDGPDIVPLDASAAQPVPAQEAAAQAATARDATARDAAAQDLLPGGAASTARTITAPLMGVFFRAPAPDQPPFVAVAQRVEPGQQVAVIEAMKLMNPVLADRAGVVREVHVADGEVVEFEQALISIEPS